MIIWNDRSQSAQNTVPLPRRFESSEFVLICDVITLCVAGGAVPWPDEHVRWVSAWELSWEGSSDATQRRGPAVLAGAATAAWQTQDKPHNAVWTDGRAAWDRHRHGHHCRPSCVYLTLLQTCREACLYPLTVFPQYTHSVRFGTYVTYWWGKAQKWWEITVRLTNSNLL